MTASGESLLTGAALGGSDEGATGAVLSPPGTAGSDDVGAALVDGLSEAVVVSPPRTALLRAAEAAGARTLDGLGMLVGQGALAVHLWTGVEPDREVMRAAAAGALGLPTR